MPETNLYRSGGGAQGLELPTDYSVVATISATEGETTPLHYNTATLDYQSWQIHTQHVWLNQKLIHWQNG